MPVSAKKPCGYPGCNVLVRCGNRCDHHKKVQKELHDKHRGSSSERGYGAKWRKERDKYLVSHPYCCEHLKQNKYVIATVVDHKIPHRLYEAKQTGDRNLILAAMRLFWDRKNWQPMCKPCHDRKTFIEDGAFSRPRGGSKV
ncbi:5-methylcytosine-specific restriction enzyme A [Nitrosomonas marina]|uniref:5-methylcytosine-specific restriction enzyme A n=1 Tax=Nitrosomonas marina TaxID=917 RepID=A0A1H8GK70_9PROT|nr:5-methylcytosine-specific restriction enzyme A [Nitrosomonas marina]